MAIDQSIVADVQELVIARLETLNPESKILLMGSQGPISVKQMIKEVKGNTPFGEQIMEVQLSYIKMLVRGEIDY